MPPDPPSFYVHPNLRIRVHIPGKPDQCNFASAEPVATNHSILLSGTSACLHFIQVPWIFVW